MSDVDIVQEVDEILDRIEQDAHAGRIDANIRLLGEPVLRKASLEVEIIDAPLVGLCHRMIFAMRRVEGLGMAGPQLGSSRRVFVWDEGYVAINPRIVESDGEQVGPESCLSMPGVTFQIRRAQRVLMQAVDIDGKGFEWEAEGIESRLFQHEIDHLDGVLALDRVTTRQQRRDALRQLAKHGLKETG